MAALATICPTASEPSVRRRSAGVTTIGRAYGLRDQAPVYDGPMGFLDSLERWFRGEADEVRESMDDAAAALNADLDRREAELKATPEEKMGRLLEEIEQSDQQLDEVTAEIRSKSETAREVADAAAETVPVEGDGPEPAI